MSDSMSPVEKRIAGELLAYVDERVATRDYVMAAGEIARMQSDRQPARWRRAGIAAALVAAVAIGFGISGLAPNDPQAGAPSPPAAATVTPSQTQSASPTPTALSRSPSAPATAPTLPTSDCPLVTPSMLPSGAEPGEPGVSNEYPGQPVVQWGSGADRILQFAGHRSTFDPASSEASPNGVVTEVRGSRALALTHDEPSMGPRLGLPSLGWMGDACPYIVYFPTGTSLEQMLKYAAEY